MQIVQIFQIEQNMQSQQKLKSLKDLKESKNLKNYLLVRTKNLILIIFVGLFLTSCTSVGTIDSLQEEIEQKIKIPESWIFAEAKSAEAKNKAWWQEFGSDELNDLVKKALDQNPNLISTAYRWQKSLLEIDGIKSSQLPTLSAGMNAGASERLSNNITAQSFGFRLGVSYQIDLWGKLALSKQNSIWSANASAEDLLATRLSLIGEVINAWLNLTYLNDQIAFNDEELKFQQKTFDLVKKQVGIGALSDLDLINARQALNALETARIRLQTQKLQAQNNLAFLLGEVPLDNYAQIQGSLRDIKVPKIDTGIPAELLRQRPDLRAAQYRLQTSLGRIEIAQRDFYPTINLSADLSAGSNFISKIFENPIGAIASSINLPFLQMGNLTKALNSNKLDYEASLIDFKKTLYKAILDVENALLSVAESAKTADILEQQLADTKEVERITKIRYEVGAESLQNLLKSQQARRDMEAKVLESRHTSLMRQVTLYLALGGTKDPQALTDDLI